MNINYKKVNLAERAQPLDKEAFKASEKPEDLDVKGINKAKLNELGVELVAAELGVEAKPTKDYDMKFKNKRVKVWTVSTTNIPDRNHPALIRQAEYDPDQGADIYVFVRVAKDLENAWIGGWITREEFNRWARPRKTGDLQTCGRRVVQAGMAVRFIHLNQMKSLGVRTG
jgi:hypothetical protein